VADAYSVYFEKISIGHTYLLGPHATLYLMGQRAVCCSTIFTTDVSEAMAGGLCRAARHFPRGQQTANAEARNGL